MKNHSPRIRAFTLVELLTVVAIIGILAGILIPVTARVRWSARSTQCTSNIRQLVQLFLLYANDNKGKLPASENPGENNAFKILYNEGYARAPALYVCPINQSKRGNDGALGGATSIGSKYPCFYSSNVSIVPKWGPKNGKTYTRPTLITDENATRLPVVFDQRANQDTTSNVNQHRPSDTQPGGVFGYLDGSAAYIVSPKDIIRLP
ncbi:type II secretion system protein [Geminisphaera colitermitum]|uniref:type II secretion system protein n=1 Tax=Geminisphaera colitermitum TaxID=1148786 RepID=UPI000158D2D4|nr:prepilin-type N-terminal cleavage/methylation domain-containing protein [Geminisphaera colitermitum]